MSVDAYPRPRRRASALIRRVASLLVAALVMAGLGVVLQEPPKAQAAAYATGGNGAYRDKILWLTWGGGVNGTAGVAMTNGNTTSATATVGSETMLTTCTMSGISGPLNSYTPGNWSGDYLDDMYNIGGSGGSNQLVNGLINVNRGASVNFTVTCTATIGGRTVDIPGMVVADAEQGTDPQEWVAATGSGTFSLIERGESCAQGVTSNNTLDVTQSGSNQTMRLIGGTAVGTCAGPAGIAYLGFNSAAYTGTNRAVSMGLTVKSSTGGLQAIAIGLILQSDVGDAPPTYTRPAHALAPVANPTLGVRATTPLNSAPLAPLTLPPLRLGSVLDADGPLAGNVGASADDLNNLDDEDGVTLPAAVDVGATASVPVVVNGGSGFLNAWFDWNRDGDFQDPGEQVISGQAVSTGTVNLNIPIPLTASPGASYARFRLCATNDCLTPGQTSTAGEVEDYPVTIRSASVTIIKDAVPNAAQVFSFSSSSAAFGSAFTLDDDAASPLPDRRTITLAPGSFTVTETDLPGWTLTGLTCTDPDGGTTTSLQTLTATIDLDGGENLVCTFTNTQDRPAIAVVKTATTNWGADSQPQAGETIIFNYRVTNTGNVAVFDTSVTEQQATFTGTGTLPAPSYLSGGSDLDAQGDAIDLAPGANALFSATYTVTQADIDRGTISNQVRAAATSPDGVAVADLSDPSSVTGNGATLTALVQAPSLRLTKSASVASFSNSGQPISYTFTLTNAGNTTLTGVTLDDPLPGLGVISCQTAAGVAVTLPATMAPAAVLTCTASYTTTAADLTAGQVRNVATADSAQTEPTSDSATVPARYADLRVTKTASSANFTPGRPLSYTVVVANLGNVPAAAVNLTDTIPAGFAVTSVTTTAGSCNAAATSCALGSIANGASVTISITGTTDPGVTSLTNSAAAATTTPDPFPGNDSASVTTTGSASADLEVVKTGPATMVSGTRRTFTIAVANRGPSNAADVVVTDLPGDGLTIVSMTAASGATCTPSACQLGTLVSGGTDTITVLAQADSAATGTVSNQATIATSTPDPNAANNTSTVTSSLQQVSDVSISKVVTSPSVPGQNREWQITVGNIGPSVAANTVVVDHLPAGVTFVSDSLSACTANAATPQDVTCDVGDLNFSQSVTFTVVGAVAPDVTGSLTNTAEVSSDSTDPSPNNNSDDASDTASPDADLSITKTGPTEATPGTSLRWAITVLNTGPSTATGITITDTAPTGVTFTDVRAPAGVVCSLELSCTVGSLAVGASVTVLVDGQIDPAATGTITNVATVTAVTPDGDPSDDSDFMTTTLTPTADLSLTKLSDADQFVPGQPLTYELHVRNNGPSTAGQVVATDPLPSSVSFVSANTPVGSCSHDGAATGGVVSCDFGAVAPGTVIDFEIVVNVDPDASGEMSNTATVTSATPDPSAANNSGTETFGADPVADLIIDKRGPATAVAGTEATYAVTVTNTGPSTATNVRVADVIPPEFTITDIVIPTGEAVCADGACTTPVLRSGESLVIQVTGVIDSAATGSMTNAAEVTTDTPDPNPSNNTDNVTTQLTSEVDVSLSKAAAGTEIAAGEVGQYEITATNNGPSTATSVIVADVMPPNATLISATSTGATCESSTVDFSCRATTLAPGESMVVVVTARVSAAAPESTITNDAKVTTTTPDTDSSNNSAQASVNVSRAADLSLTKTASSNQVVPGERFSYTLTATNNGPSDAEAVRIVDTLPEGLTLVPTPASSRCAADGQEITCSAGDLASGADYQVVLTVAVDASVPHGSTLTNVATVNSATNDPEVANDTAQVDVTASASADLVLTKTPDGASYTPGLNATFTISVVNQGPSDATDVVVTDTLPDGVSFVSSSQECVQNAGQLSCALGTLPAGESRSFEVVVATTADQVEPIINRASVSSAVTDANPDNNADTGTLNAVGLVDLAVTKVAQSTVIVAGNQVSYTLTVTNNGPSVARQVVLADAAPAGSSVISADPTVATAMTCTMTAAEASCTADSLDVGQTLTVVVVLDLRDDYADDSFSNTATATSATAESSPANNQATSTLPVERHADLSVDKTVSPSTGTAGGQATWTLTMRNAGPSNASSTVLTDTLPAGFTPGEISTEGPAAVCQFEGQQLTCQTRTMTTADVLVVTIPGVLSPDLADGTTLQNTATVTASTTDDVPDNDSAQASLPITTSADLVITKTAQPGDVVPGQNRTWTIQVANPGPSIARDVVVTDVLSDGLTFVSADGATCAADGQTVSCQLADLPVSPDPVVFTVTAAVDPSVTDPVENTATVTSTTPDADSSNNTGTASDIVTPTADVAVTKTIAQTAVAAGGSMTYQLVVTNDGSSTAAGVQLTDTLPANVTLTSISDSRCSVTAGVVGCDLGALLPGAIVSINVEVVIDSDATQAISNTATVSTTTAETDATNNSSTATITPSASADLSITKTASTAQVAAGEPVDFSLQVSNGGPSDAADVVVTDTLPAGLSLTSLPSTCSQDGQTITCQIGTLRAGQTVTVAMATLVSPDAPAASLTNSAEVASATADADSTNNVATAAVQVIPSADLAVTKTANQATVTPGETATYTLTASNRGPSTAVNAVLVDSLPVGTSFVSDPDGVCTAIEGGVSCPVGTLAPDQTSTIVVTVAVESTVADGTELTNQVQLSSDTPDETPENNTATATVTAVASAEVSLTKSGPANYTPGLPVTYTLTVANAGSSVAPAVEITDTLPAGVGFVSSTGNCQAVGQQITCAVGSVAPGASLSLDLVVTTDAARQGPLVNTATVTSSVADPNPANNTSTATSAAAGEADLMISKLADATSVAAGTQVGYTLLAVNDGPSVARNVVITDQAPAGTSIVSAEPTNGGATCTVAAGMVECTAADVAPGGSVEVRLVLLIGADYTDSQLANTATVTSETTDPEPTNNSSTATAAATRTTDLWVTKAASSATMTAGATAGWTITVGNDGPATATSVRLTDTVPAGFTATTVTSTDPALQCELASGQLTCSAAELMVGATAVVTVSGTVAADAEPGSVLTNTAVVTSAEVEADSDNNSATATATVETSADLAITKTAQGGVVTPGGERTWTIRVANAGPSVAREVVVTDVLSDGLRFVRDSGGVCTANGQTVTCALGTVSTQAPITFELTAAVDPSRTGTVDNTATVSSATPDPADGNNSATASDQLVAEADLVLTKTVAQQQVVQGEPMSYLLTLSNAGASTAATVVLTDQLPDQVRFVSVSDDRCQVAAGLLTCAVGDLLPGQIVQVTVVVEVETGGTITNTASATSSTTDANPDDNTATATVTTATVADLSVKVTADATSAAPGEQINWTINLANAGPSDATAVTVTVTVGEGQSIVSLPDGCTAAGQVVTCTVDRVDSGQPVSLNLVTVVNPTGPITLTASASSQAPSANDPSATNDTDSVSIGRDDPQLIEVTKTAAGPAVLGADGQVRATFEFTVSNRGDRTGQFTLTDEVLFGAGVRLVSATPRAVEAPAVSVADPATEPGTGPGESIAIASGELAPDQSYRYAVDLVVDTSAVTDPAAIDCTLAEGETGTGLLDRARLAEPGGGAAEQAASVQCLSLPLEPELAISKVASTTDLRAGDEVSYTITVSSTGTGPAAAVTLTDPMPTGLTQVEVTSPYNCAVSGNEVSCRLGDLASGDTRTVTVSARVQVGVDGELRNVAQAGMVNAPSTGTATSSAAATVVVEPEQVAPTQAPTSPAPTSPAPTEPAPSSGPVAPVEPSASPRPQPPLPIPLPLTGAAGLSLWLLIVTAAGGGVILLAMTRSRRQR